MPDLEAAVRELIEHPVRPPTPISELARRVRRRQFHRRVAGGLAALVVLALVVSAVQISRDGRVVQNVSTAPTYPRLPGTGVTPPGWTRVNYGRASVAVPPQWRVAGASNCSGYLNIVYLGEGSESPECANYVTPTQAVFVTLTPLQGSPAPGTAVNINDHQAIREPVSSTNRVVSEVVEFPDLGLQYESFGSIGNQIAGTIGWSAGYLALHPGQPVSIPSGWRTIHYRGVDLKVPASWPARTINSATVSPGACDNTEFVQPEVVEGNGFEPACAVVVAAAASQGTDGIWIRPDVAGLATPPGSLTLRLNGPEVDLVGQDQQYGEGVLSLIVTPINGHPVDVDIGIGSDSAIAQAILASIS